MKKNKCVPIGGCFHWLQVQSESKTKMAIKHIPHKSLRLCYIGSSYHRVTLAMLSLIHFLEVVQLAQLQNDYTEIGLDLKEKTSILKSLKSELMQFSQNCLT